MGTDLYDIEVKSDETQDRALDWIAARSYMDWEGELEYWGLQAETNDFAAFWEAARRHFDERGVNEALKAVPRDGIEMAEAFQGDFSHARPDDFNMWFHAPVYSALLARLAPTRFRSVPLRSVTVSVTESSSYPGAGLPDPLDEHHLGVFMMRVLTEASGQARSPLFDWFERRRSGGWSNLGNLIDDIPSVIFRVEVLDSGELVDDGQSRKYATYCVTLHPSWLPEELERCFQSRAWWSS